MLLRQSMNMPCCSCPLPPRSIASSIANRIVLIGIPLCCSSSCGMKSMKSFAILMIALEPPVHGKLLRMVTISSCMLTRGTFWHVLNDSTTARSCIVRFIEVVPMMSSFLSPGGRFLISTSRVCSIVLENRGPMWMNSISLSMSSITISDRGER